MGRKINDAHSGLWDEQDADNAFLNTLLFYWSVWFFLHGHSVRFNGFLRPIGVSAEWGFNSAISKRETFRIKVKSINLYKSNFYRHCVFLNHFLRGNQTIAPNAIGGVVMILAGKSITIKPHFSYPIFLQYRGDKLQGTIIADNISDLPRQSSVTIIYGRSTNFLKILDQHSNPGTNPDNKSYKCNVTLDCNHSECSNNDFVPWLFLWNRSLLCFPFVRCSIEISVHDLLHFILLVRWMLLL